MSDCKHPSIATWTITDTGEPAELWSCRECGHKFVPVAQLISAESERDALKRECEGLRNAVEAYRKVPLYTTDRNWSSDDPEDIIEICNGCGFPCEFDHDGDENCPVAVVERLAALSPANPEPK